MKAVRIHRFGGPEVLTIDDIDTPEPKDDEVLLRVKAASVNPVDFKNREGKTPFVKEGDLPVTMGRDVSGVIEALGTRADNMIRVGDPLYALLGNDRGGYAEYVVLKATEMTAPPRGCDHVASAAVPLAGLTAWQGLFDHGGLVAGQRVLIHGGAGGVGHFAVQFAKAKGATVFATASGEDLDFVRQLGAHTVIDYKEQRFEDIVSDVDVVYDLIGGETQDRSWAVLKRGGIIVSTLTEPDQDRAASEGKRGTRYTAQPNAAQLGEITALIEAGEVRPHVDRTYELADASKAQKSLENDHIRGKIVLTVG